MAPRSNGTYLSESCATQQLTCPALCRATTMTQRNHKHDPHPSQHLIRRRQQPSATPWTCEGAGRRAHADGLCRRCQHLPDDAASRRPRGTGRRHREGSAFRGGARDPAHAARGRHESYRVGDRLRHHSRRVEDEPHPRRERGGALGACAAGYRPGGIEQTARSAQFAVRSRSVQRRHVQARRHGREQFIRSAHPHLWRRER